MGAGTLLPTGPHDEFLELCAASTSGQLTEEEHNRLKEHLAVCPACREALREYESLIDDAIPAIGAAQSSRMDPGPGFSQSKAEKTFFDRFAKGEGNEAEVAENKNGVPATFRRVLPIAPESTWRHVWMLYAAGILLFITLCLSAYWVGVRRGTNVAQSTAPSPATAATEIAVSLEEQLSDAAHEREIARNQIAERDRTLADLRLRLQQQSAEITGLKVAESRLEARLRSDQAGREDLVQQRTELGHQLEAAQARSQVLQQQVDSLTLESTKQTAQAKSLGVKVEDLTRVLQDRETALNRQEELLAHDRDIRELMGARDLYIAEVYDVADNGATRKPYGRVFYTKERSLIFYAYDLDQEPGQRAQAFQAWGRRGPDFKQALNLGVFYEDNSAKKRWVLKVDNANTLAQIDAVFVTLEPHGGSDKPSGRPLLFAYLNVNPNHP